MSNVIAFPDATPAANLSQTLDPDLHRVVEEVNRLVDYLKFEARMLSHALQSIDERMSLLRVKEAVS
ncbi:hypothetical protein [Microvirga antarctica]|uniref:hypothetical protein n=1 Tax=Microvirga antarctica TaxID=2819233 RepID=UPI001B302B68|nr:hypothetical protein [Microvirga antarctica]